MNTIIKYEWKQFVRNKVAITAWILMLFIGIYAVYYGRSFRQTQLTAIIQIDTARQARAAAQLAKFDIADTATKEALYAYKIARDPIRVENNLNWMIWKQPHALQALSIGQSDNQPFYFDLRVNRNVYNTKIAELRNPAKLKAGNFDLAFVIIYLLPLLLIAYCYNSAAADKENGAARLLAAQGISQHQLLTGRLVFRTLMVITLAFIISIMGFVANKVTAMSSIAGWLLITSLYLLFWAAVGYAITSLQKNSSITALSLVSSWVFFLIIIPAALHKFQQIPDTTGLEMADADREYGNYLWKMDKARMMDTLYTVYPGWKQYQEADTNTLRSIGYTTLRAKKLNSVGQKRDSAALAAQQKVQLFNYMNPAYCTQSILNHLARTELGNFVAFKKAASDYQTCRHDYVNGFRVKNKAYTREDYNGIPVFSQPGTNTGFTQWIKGALPVMVLTVIFIFTGFYNRKKQSF